MTIHTTATVSPFAVMKLSQSSELSLYSSQRLKVCLEIFCYCPFCAAADVPNAVKVKQLHGKSGLIERVGVALHVQWFLSLQHIFPPPMGSCSCDLSDIFC